MMNMSDMFGVSYQGLKERYYREVAGDYRQRMYSGCYSGTRS